jgi:hypothetical protein
MLTRDGIDGIFHRRYSLPIDSHLVACANTEFVHIGRDRVRIFRLNDQKRLCGPALSPPAAIKFAQFSPKFNLKSSNYQAPSANMAGPMEAL